MKLLFFIPMLCMGLFSHTDLIFYDAKRTEAPLKEFRIKFKSAGDRKVEFSMDNCDVKITGYDGDEVLIEAMGMEAPPKRAEGLKPLYNTAEDNSGIGLSVTEENNIVKIVKATSHGELRYLIKVPRKVSLQFEEVNHHGHDISISGIEGDIEVNTKSSNIYLDNISGSVVASSIGGNVTVAFASLSQQKPSAISVIGSVVDVTLPADTKADFRMKSMSGEIYTDFDLAVNNDKEGLHKVGGGHRIEGKANGGGVAMSIESIGSDIFIRKKK